MTSKNRSRYFQLRRLRTDQVCPDGVVINIDWHAMEVGMSVFIPAVNLPVLETQVGIVAKTLNITLKGYDRIENGKLGMRFWRTL